MKNKPHRSLALAFPDQVLANVPKTDRIRVWQACESVSVNIRNAKASEILREIADTGCPVRTHSYPGNLRPLDFHVPEQQGMSTLTPQGAREWGRRDAEACTLAGAYAHEWNGEAGIWRGTVRRRDAQGRPTAWNAHPQAREFMLEWTTGWVIGGGSALGLWDLSFREPRRYYPDPAPVPPELAGRFTARSLMLYATSNRDSTSQALTYYRDTIKGFTEGRLNLYTSCGRQLADGSIVGHGESFEALLDGAVQGVWMVTPYIGSQGAWKQLVQGNKHHPSILECYQRPW
jgi:hypothetical protein